MRTFPWTYVLSCLAAVSLFQIPGDCADAFSVATFNLENYLDLSAGSRSAKAPEAKAGIRESIRALDADVIALQEIGSLRAFMELRDSLRKESAGYPYWEFVSGGYDTNIHVAVLSRFPIVARRSHTNESFLLYGRRFRVSRGFAEIDIRVNPGYSFTLIAAHLKSRRPVSIADQADLREEEARILREKIDKVLSADANANLIVLGDLNDVQDSPSAKLVIGRGKRGLVDTRPAERNGDRQTSAASRSAPRRITWTYYYGKEDSYSRIDYLLVSKGMAREWDAGGTYVLAIANWGVASDHRPVVARFRASDN